MSWFDRFFQFTRTNDINQPAAPHNDLPMQSDALVGPHSDIEDPLYIQAISFVLKSKRASISEVQRHLKIGYTRAARFIETMEVDGFVSSLTNGERRLLSAEERSAYLLRRNVEPTNLDIEVKQKTLRRKRLPCPEKLDLPPLTGNIRGTKNIGFDIVGESHFQTALRKIRNSRCMAEDNDFEAFIVTEPNKRRILSRRSSSVITLAFAGFLFAALFVIGIHLGVLTAT